MLDIFQSVRREARTGSPSTYSRNREQFRRIHSIRWKASQSILVSDAYTRHGWPRKHESRDHAIIEAHYSEVLLEPYRETDGHGQGSGLSGEAESQFAGLRLARLAASQ